jgi:hypothetical protein
MIATEARRKRRKRRYFWLTPCLRVDHSPCPPLPPCPGDERISCNRSANADRGMTCVAPASSAALARSACTCAKKPMVGIPSARSAARLASGSSLSAWRSTTASDGLACNRSVTSAAVLAKTTSAPVCRATSRIFERNSKSSTRARIINHRARIINPQITSSFAFILCDWAERYNPSSGLASPRLVHAHDH